MGSEETESKRGENGQHVPRPGPSRVIRGLCTRKEQRVGGAGGRCDWRAGVLGRLRLDEATTEGGFLNRVGFWVAKALEGP